MFHNSNNKYILFIDSEAEVTKKEAIEMVMPEVDVQYFTSTAPVVEGGAYDYKKWLDNIYTR